MDKNTPIVTDSEIPIRLILAALILPAIGTATGSGPDAQDNALSGALSIADQLIEVHLQTLDGTALTKFNRDRHSLRKSKKPRQEP